MVFMKRFSALAVSACMMVAVSAQNSLGIGTRGSFGLGLGTTFSGDVTDEFKVDDVDVLSSFLFGGSITARIGFEAFPGLFIQPEVGFTRNQIGFRWSDSDRDERMSGKDSVRTEYKYETSGQLAYNSIDIPVIAGYELFLTDNLSVSPFIGANLSFPFDVMSWSCGELSCTATTYVNGAEAGQETFSGVNAEDGMTVSTKVNFIPGAIVGAGIGYRFGPNLISVDFRYLLDLTSVEGKVKFRGEARDFHVLRRRGASFNLGYMFFF